MKVIGKISTGTWRKSSIKSIDQVEKYQEQIRSIGNMQTLFERAKKSQESEELLLSQFL